MKKLMYFAAALLVLAGCSKKDNALNNAPEGTPFQKGQQVTLSVGTGDNANQAAPRKVAGIDNGTNINFTWEEGDKILVKVGDATAEFTLISGEGTDAGEFAGEMPADGSNFDIQYPVEAPDLSAQEYTTDKTIPADKMLFTATGCTLGESAFLAAQYAMVQLNLYGTDKTVGMIIFKNITAKPAVSYTLTLPEGGVEIGATSTEATPFYMVVSAGEYQFEVAVYDNATTPAKICSFATSAAKTFVAGECLNMPAKEVKAATMHNGHEYVDLGLPSGIKWATTNVGATTPEGYGDYLAWGETSPKTTYEWNNYFDSNDGQNFTKYYLGGGKTILDPEDDAAHVNWGGNWRMPTLAEQDELRNTDNCTWTWQTDYNGTGVKGYLVISKKNSNTIFLPASGFRLNSSLTTVGSYGNYWSSSLNEYDHDSDCACYFYFYQSSSYPSSVVSSGCYRYYGQSVRAVCQ